MRWSDQETIRIPAPRATVYETLTRVEELPSWVSGVAHGRVLAAEGDVRVVEIVSAAGGSHTVVEVMESAPESVLFSQVDRDRRRGIAGEVQLLEDRSETVVRARLRVPSLPWRLDERLRLHQGLQAALEALRRRCHRERLPAGSRRLLSIRRGSTGALELWLDGRLYDLVPRRPGGEEAAGG